MQWKVFMALLRWNLTWAHIVLTLIEIEKWFCSSVERGFILTCWLTAIIFFSFSAHGIGEPRFRVLSQFMRTYAYQGDVASKRIDYLLMYNWSQDGQIKSNLYFYQLNVVQWAVTLFKTKLKNFSWFVRFVSIWSNWLESTTFSTHPA